MVASSRFSETASLSAVRPYPPALPVLNFPREHCEEIHTQPDHPFNLAPSKTESSVHPAKQHQLLATGWKSNSTNSSGSGRTAGDVKIPSRTCEFCLRLFSKRSRMIKHVMTVHEAEMHKLDLSKFISMRQVWANKGVGSEAASQWKEM